jgi:hypothetical protein
MSKTKISHSEMYALKTCPRRWAYQYKERLQRKGKRSTYNMLVGSAVHAGLAAALREVFVRQKTDAKNLSYPINAAEILKAGVVGVQEWQMAENSKVDINLTWANDILIDISSAAYIAKSVLTYQLPQFDFDNVWYVLSIFDVLGEGYSPDEPFIEYPFEWALPGSFFLKGAIDAALYNAEDGRSYIIDWKVRGVIGSAQQAEMDGQLPLYLAALVYNRYGDVSKGDEWAIAMWELLNEVPRPAALTTKLVPSLTKQKTTWDVWAESIRVAGFNPESYRAQMEGKLRSPETYRRMTIIPRSPALLEDALQTAGAWASLAKQYTENSATSSALAVYNYMTCQMCPYKLLCNAQRHGDNVDYLLATEFEVAPSVEYPEYQEYSEYPENEEGN